MLDNLLLRPSLHFTTLHPTALKSTSLNLSTLHFLSFKLHSTTLHYPLIWLLCCSFQSVLTISTCTLSFGTLMNSELNVFQEWLHILFLITHHEVIRRGCFSCPFSSITAFHNNNCMYI